MFNFIAAVEGSRNCRENPETAKFIEKTLSQKVGKVITLGRLRKKLQRQGTPILRNEAYFGVRCKPAPAKAGEGCSATPHMDFLEVVLKRIAHGRGNPVFWSLKMGIAIDKIHL
jgi:hypothetical protein